VRRRVLTVAWVLSLLVTLAVAGLWARSYFTIDAVLLTRDHDAVNVVSVVGALSATGAPFSEDLPIEVTRYVEEVRDGRTDLLSSLVYFRFRTFTTRPVRWNVALPHWALLVPALVLPTVAAVCRRRRRAVAGFPVEPPAPSSPPRV
jgi:hypothetical protein